MSQQEVFQQEVADSIRDIAMKKIHLKVFVSGDIELFDSIGGLAGLLSKEERLLQWSLLEEAELSSKEELINFFREIIDDDDLIGETLLEDAVMLFERLCILDEEMVPDDPIMLTPKMDAEAAMWAFIKNASIQAENKDDMDMHHDYAEGIYLSLVATAFVLKGKPVKDENVQIFIDIFGLTPNDFIERYYGG